jgi:hypothetical protein
MSLYIYGTCLFTCVCTNTLGYLISHNCFGFYQGNELHIRQADLYLREGEELSFYEILLRARQRREIVIGYRLTNAERAVINPPAKSERRRWSLKDVFVVIAEKDWVMKQAIFVRKGLKILRLQSHQDFEFTGAVQLREWTIPSRNQPQILTNSPDKFSYQMRKLRSWNLTPASPRVFIHRHDCFSQSCIISSKCKQIWEQYPVPLSSCLQMGLGVFEFHICIVAFMFMIVNGLNHS